MKINILYSTIIIIFSLTACNNSDDKTMSQAHQEAVELNETMIKTHAGFEEKLDLFKEETADLEEAIRATEPDSTSMALLKERNSTIAYFEGILTKQDKLIEQHEAYIESHENSALSPAEIKAQHTQIQKDYEMVQQEAVRMLKEIERMKRENAAVIQSK
jgi:hypothetical protein